MGFRLARVLNPTKLRIPDRFITGVRLRGISFVVERETAQIVS